MAEFREMTRAQEIIEAQISVNEYLNSERLHVVLMEKIRELLGADHASFVIEENDIIQYGASTDPKWEISRPSHTAIRAALVSENGYFLKHANDRPSSESQSVENIRSCVAAKVDIDRTLTGVVYCDLRSGNRSFEIEDALFLKELCKTFSVYFYIFYLIEDKRDLQEQTEVDYHHRADDYADYHRIVGRSGALNQVREGIRAAAEADYPVLIEGPTGSGKELVAQAIHYLSERGKNKKPFIIVNCAALPKEMIEDELFGHVKGAFTGATEYRPGRILKAAGGTLFLDEVGELPLEVQNKLLRAVGKEHEVQQLGRDEPIKNVNFRLISATNKNLHARMMEGEFRLDLLERLKGKRIYLPPLKERREDIALLAEHYAAPKHLTKEAIEYLQTLDYPGNVRELRNIVEVARDDSPGDPVRQQDLTKVVEERSHFEGAPALTIQDKGGSVTEIRDWNAWKRKHQKQIREFLKAKESNGNVPASGECVKTITKLREELYYFYAETSGNWSSAARRFFGLTDPAEVKTFLNYVYHLQKRGVFELQSTK
jgi:transcriptional regulator with GAF, ATPase, and Fis domain